MGRILPTPQEIDTELSVLWNGWYEAWDGVVQTHAWIGPSLYDDTCFYVSTDDEEVSEKILKATQEWFEETGMESGWEQNPKYKDIVVRYTTTEMKNYEDVTIGKLRDVLKHHMELAYEDYYRGHPLNDEED